MNTFCQISFWANSARKRQSGPGSGPGFRVQVLEPLEGVNFSLVIGSHYVWVELGSVSPLIWPLRYGEPWMASAPQLTDGNTFLLTTDMP